jgi:hypothetical protein
MLVIRCLVRGPDRVITGEINDEQLKRISDLTQQHPEFKEILHGPAGYKSPYRTIEQITQDRKSGVIHPSEGVSFSSLLSEKIEDTSPKAPAPAGVTLPAQTIPGPTVAPEKPKAVIETTKSGRPTIKVGTPIKTEEAPPKVEEEPKKKTTLKAGKPIDEVKTATPVKNIAEETGEVIKDVTEVLTSGEKAEEKVYEKSEEKLDEKAEKAREKLLEAVVEGEKKNARMLSAAGKAPVDSAFKKKIVSGITEVTGKTPGRTTMEVLNAAEGLSRGVLTAMKDGKNLRLAGTAALLSVAGFAVGKKRDGINKQTDAPMDVDRESALRRSLMSDG